MSCILCVSYVWLLSGSIVQEDADVAAQGKELIAEVWEVIAKKYVDVRSGGFDQQKWAQLRDAALAKPLRDKVSVERCEDSASLPYVLFSKNRVIIDLCSMQPCFLLNAPILL